MCMTDLVDIVTSKHEETKDYSGKVKKLLVSGTNRFEFSPVFTNACAYDHHLVILNGEG